MNPIHILALQTLTAVYMIVTAYYMDYTVVSREEAVKIIEGRV
jgi:hypothetical protein